jgi:hypothetical protein
MQRKRWVFSFLVVSFMNMLFEVDIVTQNKMGIYIVEPFVDQ